MVTRGEPRTLRERKRGQAIMLLASLALYPLDGSIAQHLLKLRQQSLFLFINMTIVMRTVHDLFILIRRYFKVLNGMIDKVFEA